MRATDILLFCLCINAAIVLVGASGMGEMFNPGHANGFFSADTGEYYDNTLDDIGNLESDGGFTDMFVIAASWIVENTIFMIKFLLSAVIVIPAMMDIFGFPVYLAVFIQGLLWVTYMWAYVQWKSGKSLFTFQ